MVLSENQLRIPGRMYKVNVHCIKTRRLTTVEWLILTCAEEFSISIEMKQKSLKYVFEEVFQMQSSELIIKPCLNSLKALNVIEIDRQAGTDYPAINFSHIILTDIGRRMLKEGLIPGEPREIPLSIYYNPLTGRMNHFEKPKDEKEIIEFGMESDYSNEFPEDRILYGLQNGIVGGGKFTASEFKIQSIERIVETDWNDCYTSIIARVEDGIITTVPEIVEDNIKNQIIRLFMTKEIDAQIMHLLPLADEVQVGNIMGSGNKIRKSIFAVCSNSKTIFMDARVYNAYKSYQFAFRNKTIILFGADNFLIVRDKDSTVIELPEKFDVNGCVVINEKNEHVSLFKGLYLYEEQSLEIPIAFEDLRVNSKSKKVLSWFAGMIQKRCQTNVSYYALYSLNVLSTKLKECIEELSLRWSVMDLKDIVDDIEAISVTCTEMQTEMFELDRFADSFIEKLDNSNSEHLMNSAKKLLDINCIKKQSAAYTRLVYKILPQIDAPKNYSELFVILQSVGIVSQNEAFLFDGLVGELYNHDVVVDILLGIVNETYTRLPELFELETFFNEYVEILAKIKLLVSNMDFYQKLDYNKLSNAIKNCPDIASLQSHMADWHYKQAELIKWKINIYEEMQKINEERTENLYDNMHFIENCLKEIIDGELSEKIEHSEEGKIEKRAVFVLDTCAIIHMPDLFLYFSDEEYIRIPTKVNDELGKIKDKWNPKYSAESSSVARAVCREIDRTYLRIFNQNDKVRFIIENADLSLLPPELDPTVPDNQILSVALKYKNWDLVVISDDVQFRLTCISQQIKAISTQEFKESHGTYFMSIEDRIRKYNAISPTRGANQNNMENEGEKIVNTSEDSRNSLIIKDEIEELEIDKLSLKKLQPYIKILDDKVIMYLNNNKVKTIGDLRRLDEQKVLSMKAKGQQVVLRNAVIKVLEMLEGALLRIKV